MIDVFYNDLMIRKAKAIYEEARQLHSNDREAYCQDKCGLSYSYLSRIGKSMKQPSARTMMNLGFEVLARDVATGETQVLEMNLPCDWNPRNPRMNPSSTKLLIGEPEEASTPSE